MKYDFQLIIAIPTGPTTAALKAVTESASRLQFKNAFKGVNVEWVSDEKEKAAPMLKYVIATHEAFAKMTDESRLYIVGHGDAKATTLAGLSGTQLAKSLVDNGLKKVKRVVLASCLAGNPNSSDPFASLLAGTELAFKSTAKEMHLALGKLQIFAEVAARTEIVSVLEDGSKVTRPLSELATPQTAKPKKPGTKIVYGWNDKKEQTTSYPYGET